ncbi:uncharacterized protein LOC103149151 [Poecilia formosa]|uniref:uncharacterized protein LOC103149151 n=1 Tax=Poecilia formosa TaxID=48698 RepID=UPI0007B9820D|nr:PREDICTED: uncharacterized protein LOC103149151 [Poecilia formosa]
MFLLVLSLLVSGSQASHFLGTMMTYYPGETQTNGSVSVILRYKQNFVECSQSVTWNCEGNCGSWTRMLPLTKVEEVSGEWCQTEGVITHQLPNNTGFQTKLDGGAWINNILNRIVNWRAVAAVELRNRSDIGKPNTSPQTTILPALRVPVNCPRTINLLAFDPDGDEVKCRYGNATDSECNPCDPPPVLNVSSSCSLTFSSSVSNTSSELRYAVQLVVEDFPRQTITLTETGGSQEVKTTSDAISKIPLQFALKVIPEVPSCAEGSYVARFLPPTPDNRAQKFIQVNKVLEINIRAEATHSTVTGLLFSGPHNVSKSSSGSGSFTLSWTPTAAESGQSHPICFVVETSYNYNTYHSELRCVAVTVGNYYVVALRGRISTSLSLENDYDALVKQIKDELTRRGLHTGMNVRLHRTG